MNQEQAVLCSSCRKLELVSIPYPAPDGSETHVEVCSVCDGTASWPRLKQGKE